MVPSGSHLTMEDIPSAHVTTDLKKLGKDRSSLFGDLYGSLSPHEIANELAVDVHQLTLGELQKVNKHSVSCDKYVQVHPELV